MNNRKYFDFEEPICKLEEQMLEETDELKKSQMNESMAILKKDIYNNLSAINILKIARHQLRPYALDYINNIADTGTILEINGDRHFANDEAIITVFAKIEGKKVLFIGEQKGRTIEDKKKRNFGMPHPEGYRKAMRAADLAEKFNIPIITLVDTPGAYPGIEAEERGQSEAIAESIYKFSSLKVPVISIIIGEGGSGGALAISVANKLAILKYSVFSVISPEGCAAILWKDSTKTIEAIQNLKMTSDDLLKQKIVDDIIDEPLYGAHTNYEETFEKTKEYILNSIVEFSGYGKEEILQHRYDKIREYGNIDSDIYD